MDLVSKHGTKGLEKPWPTKREQLNRNENSLNSCEMVAETIGIVFWFISPYGFLCFSNTSFRTTHLCQLSSFELKSIHCPSSQRSRNRIDATGNVYCKFGKKWIFSHGNEICLSTVDKVRELVRYYLLNITAKLSFWPSSILLWFTLMPACSGIS